MKYNLYSFYICFFDQPILSDMFTACRAALEQIIIIRIAINAVDSKKIVIICGYSLDTIGNARKKVVQLSKMETNLDYLIEDICKWTIWLKHCIWYIVQIFYISTDSE